MSESHFKEKKLELDLYKAIERLPQFITDTQIRAYLGPLFSIYKYSELEHIQDITHILHEDKCCCIILIESEYNSGHFVALGRKGNTIIQWDSYGSQIDTELNFVTNAIKKILGEDKKILNELIKKSGMNTIFNKTKYQSTKKIYGVESAICGRTCIVFCQLFKLGYTLEEIKTLIDNKREHYEMLFMENLPYDIIFSLLVK